jgi:hypothetical protein
MYKYVNIYLLKALKKKKGEVDCYVIYLQFFLFDLI